MCNAQLCPVCGGSGQVWINDPNTSSVGYYTTCHGCGGSGWVTVQCCKSCPSVCYPSWYYEDGSWWYSSGHISINIGFDSEEESPNDC